MIGVVVLTYNTWNATAECIESFYSYHDINSCKMYIVDNASNISISKKCKELIGKYNLRYIKALDNKGYAAGNNLGIKEAIKDGCTYILISNNDIVYNEEILHSMHEDYKLYPDAAIVAPKVLLTNGEIQETNLGCPMTLKGKYLYLLRKTPLKRISKKFVDSFQVDILSHCDVFCVHGVSGCCFMISTSALTEINLFDEHTFLYEEENILSAQIAGLGKKVYIDPKIKVVHHHGLTTNNVKPIAFKAHVASEIYYCKKYLKASNMSILPLILIRCAQYCRNLYKKEYRKELKNFIKGIKHELFLSK